MLRRFISIHFLGGLCALAVQTKAGFAQLAVQQPVFGVNSVNTTVSVPDRGRAHLGSISRAREGRTSFGPFRPGTNTGIEREHTGMSAGVYIHDFEAMDQYLLNQGSHSSLGQSSPLSGNAGHAWNQLQAQSGTVSVRPPLNVERASKSQKYWELGQQAEREGKLNVARLHYRIAGQYGSQAALEKLKEWDSPQAQIANSKE